VIIRTLDVGGDKEIPYLDLPSEPNPFLGYRAVRLYFERPEIYKPQLRAILRASWQRPCQDHVSNDLFSRRGQKRPRNYRRG
jgi:phosphoenolpyruvate-protein kinase (PTS system EI component)